MSISNPEIPNGQNSQATLPLNQPTLVNPESIDLWLFRENLMNHLGVGISFVDAFGKILVWSKPLESMTGLRSTQMEGTEFTCSTLSLRNSEGVRFGEESDPIKAGLRSPNKTSLPCMIQGRSGREVKVELSIVPVIGPKGELHGGIILIEDTSLQLDLQRQLKDLYKFSTLDPLTKVSNRGEFERVLDEFVRMHHSSDFKCSIIICDIDFFKQINDNYNHHVGDMALVSFAKLLKNFVRSQDLIARYGGEEFVILCANCDQQSAVERAEEIRHVLSQTSQDMLDGKCMTASFGVAELREEESGTDFFVRADSALLRAKELGRNRVVEAGSVEGDQLTLVTEETEASVSGIQWRKLSGQPLVSEEYRVDMPVSVVVEKLRGYILETDSEINRVGPDFASLTCEYEDPENYARRGSFLVDVEFQERELDEHESSSFGNRTKSFLRIVVRPGRRKWFSTNCDELAPNLVGEIRKFLTLTDDCHLVSIQPHATKSNR